MAFGAATAESGVTGILSWRADAHLRMSRRRLVVQRVVIAIAIAIVVVVAVVAACRGGDRTGDADAPEASALRSALRSAPIVDDFGDTLRMEAPPTRIVSLNPATTEILFAIGAGARVVGRTTWDLYPDSARAVADLGAGLRPNVEAVLAARPQLVMLYASDDNRSAARTLRRAGIQTLTLRIDRIAEFVRATRLVGIAIGDTVRARHVIDSVQRTLDRVRRATAALTAPTVLWRVWDRPLLVIGGGSYLSELAAIAGGRNVYADLPQPSPAVTTEDVLKRDPQFILTSPGGEAAWKTSATWRGLAAVRAERVLIVDTALVGRPAVRLGEAAVSLARLLHPGLVLPP